jgi:hypothetical protein
MRGDTLTGLHGARAMEHNSGDGNVATPKVAGMALAPQP